MGFKFISIAVDLVNALLLHGEADPMMGLLARATSADSVFVRKGCGGSKKQFAVSGQVIPSFQGGTLACGYLRVVSTMRTFRIPQIMASRTKDSGHGASLYEMFANSFVCGGKHVKVQELLVLAGSGSKTLENEVVWA